MQYHVEFFSCFHSLFFCFSMSLCVFEFGNDDTCKLPWTLVNDDNNNYAKKFFSLLLLFLINSQLLILDNSVLLQIENSSMYSCTPWYFFLSRVVCLEGSTQFLSERMTLTSGSLIKWEVTRVRCVIIIYYSKKYRRISIIMRKWRWTTHTLNFGNFS